MAADNVRRFEFRLGKWGLTLFAGGMSLLVFFAFLFGVRVGKEIDAYPEKYSWGIAKQLLGMAGLAENGASSKTVVAVREAGKDRPANENAEYDLSFYDTLSKKSNSLRPQQSAGESAQQSAAGPATDAGERGASLPAAPSVPQKGFLPGDRPDLKQKERQEPVESETERGAVHQPKTLSRGEKEKPPTARPAHEQKEKGVESAAAVAEKRGVSRTDKNLIVEKKAEPKGDKKVADEKRIDATAEKISAAEKKTARSVDRQDVKKEEKGKKPEAKKYLVQVGSYRDKGKADQMAAKLNSLGYTARIVPMDLPGKGRWYRLTLSGLSSQEKAKEAAAAVEKKIGGSKGFIRPE